MYAEMWRRLVSRVSFGVCMALVSVSCQQQSWPELLCSLPHCKLSMLIDLWRPWNLAWPVASFGGLNCDFLFWSLCLWGQRDSQIDVVTVPTKVERSTLDRIDTSDLSHHLPFIWRSCRNTARCLILISERKTYKTSHRVFTLTI